MTNRVDLIESICSVVIETNDYSDDQRFSAKKLLEQLSSNRISEEEALNTYKKIISEGSSGGYWLQKYKSKVVYESLEKYKSGELSLLGTCKMISSLITHSFIEIEKTKDKNLNASILGIPDLISILDLLTKEQNLTEEVKVQIDSVLKKYGYIEREEGGDQ